MIVSSGQQITARYLLTTNHCNATVSGTRICPTLLRLPFAIYNRDVSVNVLVAPGKSVLSVNRISTSL